MTLFLKFKRMNAIVLVLFFTSSLASPSDWIFQGEVVVNQNDLVVFLQNILDQLYYLKNPITASVQWTSDISSDSSILAYTYPEYIPWQGGYQVSSLVKQYTKNMPSTSPPPIDFIVNVNPTVNWYYGVDGKLSSNQEDMATVLLHEVHHGL